MSNTIISVVRDTAKATVTVHPNPHDVNRSKILKFVDPDRALIKSYTCSQASYLICSSMYQLTCVGQGANPPSPSNLPGIVGNNKYQSKVVYYRANGNQHTVTTPINYQSSTGLMGYYEPLAELPQDSVYGNKIRNASTMDVYLRIPKALVNFLTNKKFVGNIFFDRFPDKSGIYTLSKTVIGTNPAGFTDEIKNASTVSPKGQYYFYIDCNVITTNTTIAKHFTFDCEKTINVNIYIEFL